MISLQLHLGHTCKKFQVNRIMFTMEKVSSIMHRQAHDFFSRVFPFCTRSKKQLCCDVNFYDIQFFFSQFRPQFPGCYTSFIALLSVQQFRCSNQSLPSVTIQRGSPRRMSQRCHKFSFVCHAQTSRDRRKRTTPRERAENLLQNCLFSKKSLVTLRCRDFFKNKKPKALQFSRRTRAAFLIPDNVSPNLSLFRRGRYEFERDPRSCFLLPFLNKWSQKAGIGLKLQINQQGIVL